jgi:hypothetical protein
MLQHRLAVGRRNGASQARIALPAGPNERHGVANQKSACVPVIHNLNDRMLIALLIHRYGTPIALMARVRRLNRIGNF